MREYQIFGCTDAAKLVDALDSMAREGWRPIGFTMKALGTALQSYECLLEREVEDGRSV